ncbi:MAG: GIY-YIG nuclease family protein [Bacteroidetes bacterium]|nr:GIY-YIG nuclease family protein [Bacteroidota bacterium]MBL0329065.1 GIY-YIG nuclease family protein [Bacteroidota bacterium]
MHYYVYILKSLKDNGYYYGYTSDLPKRLERHNSLLVKSTKARAPFVIHYTEMFNSKTEAIKREKFFKSIDGYNWLKENNIT